VKISGVVSSCCLTSVVECVSQAVAASALDA